MIAEKLCPKCETTKALDEYTIRKSGPRVGQPVSRCKECQTAAFKERKERDPTIYRRCEWPSKIKRAYGITPDDYYRMLAEQGGGCATCGSKSPGDRHYRKSGKMEFFSIDHCHTTGKVRGLLCVACNTAIGLIKDSPETAASISAYLR